MIKHTLITGPAVEPLTLDEAKDHLRVEHTEDDLLIDALIVVARELCEQSLNRPLINQTWRAKFDKWPRLGCELALGADVQSITSVKYQDVDNVQQTLASSVYELSGGLVKGVRLAYDQEWPEIIDHPEVIEVDFVAGFGAAAADVPTPIKQAMLLLIGDMYEHREDSSQFATSKVMTSADLLLSKYMVPYL